MGKTKRSDKRGVWIIEVQITGVGLYMYLYCTQLLALNIHVDLKVMFRQI